MKKTLFCGVVLFLAFTATVFANRSEINDFLKSYESFVVEVEKLAKKTSVGINDFTALAEKAKDLEPKATAAENYKDWTDQDAQHFYALMERCQKAFEMIVPKLEY
jgi:hypothetical protein